MAAGGAFCAYAQLADGQAHLVGDDNDIFRGNLVELDRLDNGFAGEVHIGLGLHKQYRLSAQLHRGSKCLEAGAVYLYALVLGKSICGHEARVVAGALVLESGIAQKYHEPLYTAGFSKKHYQSKRLEIETSS